MKFSSCFFHISFIDEGLGIDHTQLITWMRDFI